MPVIQTIWKQGLGFRDAKRFVLFGGVGGMCKSATPDTLVGFGVSCASGAVAVLQPTRLACNATHTKGKGFHASTHLGQIGELHAGY